MVFQTTEWNANGKQVTVDRSMFESVSKMTVPIKIVFFLSFIVSVFSKELHAKETLETKDRDAKAFMSILNNQDFFKNLRYVRHVKAVTESVLDHLIGEIKHQYLKGEYNANSPIPRLIRNLNNELKRNERQKLLKGKAKKKNASKKKSKSKVSKGQKKSKMAVKKIVKTTQPTTEQSIGVIA